jgi:hypothetical protein
VIVAGRGQSDALVAKQRCPSVTKFSVTKFGVAPASRALCLVESRPSCARRLMQLTEAEGFQASLLVPGTAGRPAVERAPWRNKRATYQQSLDVLAHAKTVKPDLLTKTSTMLGLGESRQEVIQTMKDLRAAGVDVPTLGQFLRPSPGGGSGRWRPEPGGAPSRPSSPRAATGCP